jgi:tetratricopeptide (TPR) repeat protein
MKLKPAYDAYDEGRKALAEDKIDAALAGASKALNLFDGEAHFHALRGDIRLVQKNYDWAATNYTRAIERRDDFFYYHLQRGIARKQLGQRATATADLERSLELLPTAPAHAALGDLAKERGDLQAALQHYKVVAQSGGEYGKAAAIEVARMEFPSNPSAYIPHACSADSQGMLVVSVRNDAPLAVAGVQVAVGYVDSAGRQQERRLDVGRQLDPGEIASAVTGFAASGSCPVRVVAAQIRE